jgi:hypothetical protein
VLSALLSAPSFLSGLSDAEVLAAKAKAESFMPKEVAEAKAATVRAMAETEKGWSKAISLIGEKADLVKDARTGAWTAPQATATAA